MRTLNLLVLAAIAGVASTVAGAAVTPSSLNASLVVSTAIWNTQAPLFHNLLSLAATNLTTGITTYATPVEVGTGTLGIILGTYMDGDGTNKVNTVYVVTQTSDGGTGNGSVVATAFTVTVTAAGSQGVEITSAAPVQVRCNLHFVYGYKSTLYGYSIGVHGTTHWRLLRIDLNTGNCGEVAANVLPPGYWVDHFLVQEAMGIVTGLITDNADQLVTFVTLGNTGQLLHNLTVPFTDVMPEFIVGAQVDENTIALVSGTAQLVVVDLTNGSHYTFDDNDVGTWLWVHQEVSTNELLVVKQFAFQHPTYSWQYQFENSSGVFGQSAPCPMNFTTLPNAGTPRYLLNYMPSDSE